MFSNPVTHDAKISHANRDDLAILNSCQYLVGTFKQNWSLLLNRNWFPFYAELIHHASSTWPVIFYFLFVCLCEDDIRRWAHLWYNPLCTMYTSSNVYEAEKVQHKLVITILGWFRAVSLKPTFLAECFTDICETNKIAYVRIWPRKYNCKVRT